MRAFGINVPRMVTLTYGFGVALAAFAGVLAAPINQVRPGMGADIIAVVFAVVVIGGMGSILGSIVTGFVLGVVEGLTKVFYPEASNTVVFVIMAIVLLIRPTGLLDRRPDMEIEASVAQGADIANQDRRVNAVAFVIMVVLIAIAPFFAYPFFVMQAMCFALFACAFNLLIGYASAFFRLGTRCSSGSRATPARTPPKCGAWSPSRRSPWASERRHSQVRHRSAGYPERRHLLRDDHHGLFPDGVFLLRRGAVHSRRGWHQAVRKAGRLASSISATRGSSTVLSP